MKLLHRPAPSSTTAPAPPAATGSPTRRDDGDGPSTGVVVAVQRGGALVVAAVLLVFGILGFANGLAYFSTEGGRVAGLSSNGLLSTVSVVTAVVLVVAALRSVRTVSTVMVLVGAVFLLSAMVNLAVLETDWNVLAFSMANVIFSICAGLVLLTLGSYGRFSGNLPEDSPYHRPRAEDDTDDADTGQQLPSTPAEYAAERAMREAERAVVEHRATPEQARLVAAMAQVRTRAERREVWLRSATGSR
ncbi:DUF4383 domain-containing protein [Modestobacter sp. NPDC049651]|uniref:DUF4383 domain-containing protein n=1 Tax=unclassified Modestobacter TaxID=2643866 RepID=UPI003410003F